MNILRYTLLILTLGLILAVSTLPASARTWNMFHGDPQHTGYTSCDAPFDSLFDWSHATSDSVVFSSPVVGPDGTIYVGNVDKELVAISFFGQRIWTFQADGNFRYSTPALAVDGTIYIGGSDGQLYAVHGNGNRKWTFQAGGAVKTSPNIADDGTIYFGSDDGLLYAVNPDSTLKWTYPTADTVRCSPTIAPDGTVFVGSNDGNLYAIWPDGTLRWSAATGGPIKYCSPAVSGDGIVYFGSYDGLFYAVTIDQQFLWAYPTGHSLRSSPALGDDGLVYIGAGDKLLAIRDGNLEWDFSTGGTIMGSPGYWADDFVVCFGSTDNVFYCLHDDGSTDWTFALNAPIYSTPAPSCHGDIYIADVLGTVWAMGNATTAVEDPFNESNLGLSIVGPNPTRGGIHFQMPPSAGLSETVQVLDLLGRVVARLTPTLDGGLYWNGRTAAGEAASPGVYFVRADQPGPAARLVVIR